MTQTTLNFSVDWISATTPHRGEGNRVEMEMFKTLNEAGSYQRCKPLHGYTDGIRWEHGAMAFYHHERHEMGTHFVLSGQCLKALAACGYDAVFLLSRFIASEAKLTIVHLALDVFDGGYTPRQMYEDFEGDKYKGRARRGSQRSEKGRGYTAYIGSWSSDKFYRFYDKAKEQKIKTPMDWCRLELVLKGNYAKVFGQEFKANMSLDWMCKVFRSTVKGLANFQNEAFQKFIEGEIEKLSLPQGKEKKTREWLLTQVAAAVANYIVETGDELVLEDLGAEITRLYNEKIVEREVKRVSGL